MINGAGHQFFLGTAAALVKQMDQEQIEKVLFASWRYEDEKLSFRWDPIEDRQHAHMWTRPTKSTPKTVWAANLLAFRGLQLLPSVPGARRLETTGFIRLGRRGLFFTWPIWAGDLDKDPIRTMLAVAELGQECPDRRVLARMGVSEVYRCERVKVGKYTNFSPAQAV